MGGWTQCFKQGSWMSSSQVGNSRIKNKFFTFSKLILLFKNLGLTPIYRITLKGDDCTEFMMSVSLYLLFPATVKLFNSLANQ